MNGKSNIYKPNYQSIEEALERWKVYDEIYRSPGVTIKNNAELLREAGMDIKYYINKEFDWEQTISYTNSLENSKAKILYLIERKAACEILNTVYGTEFIRRCEVEISKLERILSITSNSKPGNFNELSLAEIMLNEKVNRVLKELAHLDFPEFLKSKNISEQVVKELFVKYGDKELVPFCMALFHAIGYSEYFFTQICKSKQDGFKKLSRTFEVSERIIRGNVNILIPGSKEDAVRYTSPKYLNDIRNGLQGV